MENRTIVSQPIRMQQAFQPNQWNTGLFDCCDNCGDCCLAYFCFWCTACQTSKDFGECLCLPLVDYFGLGGCVPAVAMAMRAELRERYGIKGSLLEDFMFATFFGACVYCQVSREIQIRNRQLTFVNVHHL